jgi:hypothetical protein
MGKYPPMVLTSTQPEILNAIFDTFLAPLTSSEEKGIVPKIQGRESIYQVNSHHVSTIPRLSASSLNI